MFCRRRKGGNLGARKVRSQRTNSLPPIKWVCECKFMFCMFKAFKRFFVVKLFKAFLQCFEDSLVTQLNPSRYHRWHRRPATTLVTVARTWSWRIPCRALWSAPSTSGLGSCGWFWSVEEREWREKLSRWLKLSLLTIEGACIQGSPSICMGKVFLVSRITSLHCAIERERRDERKKCQRRCLLSKSTRHHPINVERKFKYLNVLPMLSIPFVLVPCEGSFLIQLLLFYGRRCLRTGKAFIYSLAPAVNLFSFRSPWMAMDKSTELKLCVEISLSVARRRFILLKGPALDVLRRIRFCDKFSPHRLEPPWLYGIFSKATPCSGTPFKSSLTPSHVSSTNSWRFLHVAEKVSLVAYSKYHSLFFILELNCHEMNSSLNRREEN